MSLSRKQMQILAVAIKYRLDILKVHLQERQQLLDGIKSLINEGKMVNLFFEPLLKILNYPNEVDKALLSVDVGVATKYVKEVIVQDLLEMEAELNTSVSGENQQSRDIQTAEAEKRQEEDYLQRLVHAPVFVSCSIPKEAFDLETNSIKSVNNELTNAITIGSRDECVSLDDQEKLADVLLYGFNRPGLSSADCVQVILRFKNLYDLDFFRRNKAEGFKRVDKYYTPALNMDFSGAVLLNKEARLALSKEHNFADIQYHQIQIRRTEILRAINERKVFVELQITRLTGLHAADTEKCQTFTQIKLGLETLIAELSNAKLETLTPNRLEQYGTELVRIEHWLRDNSSAHRDTGVKGFFAGTSFRMPTSYGQFEETFAYSSGPRVP